MGILNCNISYMQSMVHLLFQKMRAIKMVVFLNKVFKRDTSPLSQLSDEKIYLDINYLSHVNTTCPPFQPFFDHTVKFLFQFQEFS